MNTITFRNALTDMNQQVPVQAGQTVRQTVESSGFIAPGNNFSVRDKDGQIVDEQPADRFVGQMLSVGLPGDNVVGGGAVGGAA
ncbi:hypothetical protein [Allorhizocola rhizosphaerae]|uniref:hypothetical protein n=1 Tax=Allorhizocola rhizosphaerae TaxID=1872709 RepID=UPI000E3B9223|nr:hypothetical protein [Allorhizocola rhizosphaerae]